MAAARLASWKKLSCDALLHLPLPFLDTGFFQHHFWRQSGWRLDFRIGLRPSRPHTTGRYSCPLLYLTACILRRVTTCLFCFVRTVDTTSYPIQLFWGKTRSWTIPIPRSLFTHLCPSLVSLCPCLVLIDTSVSRQKDGWPPLSLFSFMQARSELMREGNERRRKHGTKFLVDCLVRFWTYTTGASPLYFFLPLFFMVVHFPSVSHNFPHVLGGPYRTHHCMLSSRCMCPLSWLARYAQRCQKILRVHFHVMTISQYV